MKKIAIFFLVMTLATNAFAENAIEKFGNDMMDVGGVTGSLGGPGVILTAPLVVIGAGINLIGKFFKKKAPEANFNEVPTVQEQVTDPSASTSVEVPHTGTNEDESFTAPDILKEDRSTESQMAETQTTDLKTEETKASTM